MHLSFKFGIVSEYKAGFAKVYFASDDIVTGWWPILMRSSKTDLQSWPLNIQEHVVCVCDHHLEEGVVLGAIHSDPEPADSGSSPHKFRTIFEDGTLLEYDKATHKLTANVHGSAEVTALTTATIQAPVITLKGAVTVEGIITAAGLSLAANPDVVGGDGKFQGDLHISGNVEASGDVQGGDISLKLHHHTAVQSGTGVSGPPA